MTDDEGGRFGKLRRLFNDQVVERLKDEEARSRITGQVKEHASDIAAAGGAVMSRFSSSGEAAPADGDAPASDGDDPEDGA